MNMMSRRPYRVSSLRRPLMGSHVRSRTAAIWLPSYLRTPKIDGVPIGPRRKHVPSNINIR